MSLVRVPPSFLPLLSLSSPLPNWGDLHESPAGRSPGAALRRRRSGRAAPHPAIQGRPASLEDVKKSARVEISPLARLEKLEESPLEQVPDIKVLRKEGAPWLS